MNLKILRETFNKDCTIGKLYVNGFFQCFTLEDVCREDTPGTWTQSLKVHAKTAIPYGTYKVVVDFSQRFQKNLPHLLDVPDFVGVRIHSGNTDKDTEGCILVGEAKAANNVAIGNSRAAMAELMLTLLKATDPVYLTIEQMKGP